jgi:ribosomal protein S18 acetylase RimI-like enzyme
MKFRMAARMGISAAAIMLCKILGGILSPILLENRTKSMSEPSPRRAVIADAIALNALARAAYAIYLPVIGREPQPMATDWQTLFASQEIWTVDGPSGPLASLALEVEPDHVVIWSVAVLPEYQGKGLGRRLLEFAEARSRELRRPEIRLFTNAKMVRNIALYRSLGYAETRREELPDRAIVHMGKRLDIAAD